MDYPKYDRASPNTPLANAELQQLDELLQTLPADGAMSLDGMDGYLTALLVGPSKFLDTQPSADWLPLIWGGDSEGGKPFASNQKRKRTTVMVLRHLQALACTLRDDPDNWQPIFSVAEQGEQEWADASDWCTGFLQATDLDPEAWAPWFDDAELGPALVPIALLGGEAVSDAPEADLDKPEVRDELSRAAADAVMAMWAHSSAAQAGTRP
jgi:uncharacterized protein